MSETPDLNHMETLKQMGFDEHRSRQALIGTKNDLPEAISLLTESEELESNSPGDLERMDTKTLQGSDDNLGPPALLPEKDTESDELRDSQPPSYEEALTGNSTVNANASTSSEQDALEEFPLTNLYELEGRVFTDSWSIPFRRSESLGKCLQASINLARHGLTEEENCKRFLDRCLPECFDKLHQSTAVQRWGRDIQDGIYDMTDLLMEVIATRLKHEPTPIKLLSVLCLVWNKDTEFQFKHRRKNWDETLHGLHLGYPQTYAVSPQQLYKEPYGWLVNLINHFGAFGGFEAIQDRVVNGTNLDVQQLAALLSPLGYCVEFMLPPTMQPILAPVVEKCIHYVKALTEEDLKHKEVGQVSELLQVLKLCCLQFWTRRDAQQIDELRLHVVMRMLKTPHFNAKMNSLKEVMKLIDEAQPSGRTRQPVSQLALLDWLVDNKVLSIALEGNLDQAQYCDRLKGIMEFLGIRLQLEELSTIWKMQENQHPVVVDNIHGLMASAAVRFSSGQLDHLFQLLKQSWTTETNRNREKLLVLIGKLGREDRGGRIVAQVLELLWELAHLDSLPTEIVEQALKSHSSILVDSFSIKESVRRMYAIKCIEDIKKGVWVVPAFKQLLKIAKAMSRQIYHKPEKAVLTELHRQHDLVKTTVNSLIRCHRKAGGKLVVDPDTRVDGRYTHAECMVVHMKFLGFVLTEVMIYLAFKFARDIWDTLVSGPDACQRDQELCFEWLTQRMADMEAETQQLMFTQKVLAFDAAKLTPKSFECIKTFFYNVNENERRMKRVAGRSIVVEKLDLHGLDYMWQVALSTPMQEVADEAIKLLLQAYISGKQRKDLLVIHKRFIQECYNRLEESFHYLGDNVTVAQAIHLVTKTATAPSTHDLTVQTVDRTCRLQSIERLLLLAERYVITSENTSFQRTAPPHGSSFHGQQVGLQICCDQQKPDFPLQVHSNETVLSVRQRIASHLSTTADYIQIHHNDQLLSTALNYKLLRQMEIEDSHVLIARVLYNPVSSVNNLPDNYTNMPPQRQSYLMELEKQQPSVLMASTAGVFDILYRLAALCEPSLTVRVRSLLMLLPTDPAIAASMDNLIQPDGVAESSGAASGFVVSSSSTLSLGSDSEMRQSEDSISTTSQSNFNLATMLDPNAAGMSAFRVLYNLEVLSARLMPVKGQSDVGDAELFIEGFLAAGGVPSLLGILKDKVIAGHVDYEIHQDIFFCALQLLRLVFMHMVSVSLAEHDDKQTDQKETSDDEVCNQEMKSLMAKQHMPLLRTLSSEDIESAVLLLMRVAWAAAAGNVRHPLPGDEPPSPERRLRLRPGLCLSQHEVTEKDALIAADALMLLVLCFQHHSESYGIFCRHPLAADFIIDVLTGSSHAEVRSAGLDQFRFLSEVRYEAITCSGQTSPHQFVVHTLLKSALPFWNTPGQARGDLNNRLMEQCLEYFELLCQLLTDLTADAQEALGVNIAAMLDTELTWLANSERLADNAEKTDSACVSTLLTGHLNLARALFTCQGVDKAQKGAQLVKTLLHDFLFEASKVRLDLGADAGSSARARAITSRSPRCNTTQARVAAYRLLVVLAENCPSNLQYITQQLTAMHHQSDPEVAKQWEFQPLVAPRALCGFVGLRNASATCYMNAVLQQFYMQPGIKEAILAVDDPNMEEDNMFFQVQCILTYLIEGKQQYHSPDKFWKVFKLWGQTVNVREQQDAFEFFCCITDQLDETLKKYKMSQIFQKTFGGIFLDQKICRGCPHRYEREEAFCTIQLGVTSGTLKESLELFVKGELLEGDNAYFCEKCKEKRDTLKRTCIKTLPLTLVLQLKRFGYDWEAGRALKFDDHFEFPWVVDMSPYTASGLASKDDGREDEEQPSEDSPDKDDIEHECSHGGSGEGSSSSTPVSSGCSSSVNQIGQKWYELVGVVVHSGQANAGHYYSFIKNRQSATEGSCTTATLICPENNQRNSPPAPSPGKWYKFNDTLVDEFDMTADALEQECFGGTYKARAYDSVSSFPETRHRYWNGYMLFYQAMFPTSEQSSAQAVIESPLSSPITDPVSPRGSTDRLSQLTALVMKGERKGLFTDKVPGRILNMVQEDNLQFMQNRDVYSQEYFHFVRQLVAANMLHLDGEEGDVLALSSLQLAVQFLFNTYFRTKKRLRTDMTAWNTTLSNILRKSVAGTCWLLDYLAMEAGLKHITPLLLECSTAEVRNAFGTLLERTFHVCFEAGISTENRSIGLLLDHLLSLLDKEVVDNCKSSSEFFWLLRSLVYTNSPKVVVPLLLDKGAFTHLLGFLLGPTSTTSSHVETNVDTGETSQVFSGRRWSSQQSKEFYTLHVTLDQLILACDVSEFYTVADADQRPFPFEESPELFPMPGSMKASIFGSEGARYARELVWSCREIDRALSQNMAVACYCSWCNATYSTMIINEILTQLTSAPANELRALLTMLSDLLGLDDCLQQDRLKQAVEGPSENAVLGIIKSCSSTDSRRAYQCIKFLVNLSTKCSFAKVYLLERSSRWQWAVKWLRGKINEQWTSHSWQTSNETSTSKHFQRTMSAQDTLAEADALLTQIEAQERSSNMRSRGHTSQQQDNNYLESVDD